MNQEKDKITPLKNSEDHNRLVAKYEAEIENHKQETLDWKNAAISKDDTILELKKQNERTEKEKDDWKQEALATRKVYTENKKTQEQTSFIQELAKLQQKKGIIIETNN